MLGIFDEELLKNEFNPNSQDVYIESLHRLNDFYTLTQKEIDDNCNKVLEGLNKGVYNVYTHQYVFDTLYPLSTKLIIAIKIPELKEKVFSSLKIAKSRNEFDQYSFSSGEVHFLNNEDSKDVFNHIKDLHTNYFNEQKDSLINDILFQLDKEKADYTKVIHSFLNIKLSDYFTADQITGKLSKTTNHNIIKFARFVAEKYRNDGYTTFADIPLLEGLESFNEKTFSDATTSPLLKATYSDFNRILKNILDELKKRLPQQNTNNQN